MSASQLLTARNSDVVSPNFPQLHEVRGEFLRAENSVLAT